MCASLWTSSITHRPRTALTMYCPLAAPTICPVQLFLQDIGQLKTMFEKEWESLMAQCDEFLYLGGNDTATYKYVSERLGKETIFPKRPRRPEVRMVRPAKTIKRLVQI